MELWLTYRPGWGDTPRRRGVGSWASTARNRSEGVAVTHRIRITSGEIRLSAALNQTDTAQALLAALPLEAPANRWGAEIYFSIPVEREGAPDARAEMEVGELGYWPPGRAFCIFFGPTPASHGDEPRAASPVNPVGRVLDDPTRLEEVPDGAIVRIELAE